MISFEPFLALNRATLLNHMDTSHAFMHGCEISYVAIAAVIHCFVNLVHVYGNLLTRLVVVVGFDEI